MGLFWGLMLEFAIVFTELYICRFNARIYYDILNFRDLTKIYGVKKNLKIAKIKDT